MENFPLLDNPWICKYRSQVLGSTNGKTCNGLSSINMPTSRREKLQRWFACFLFVMNLGRVWVLTASFSDGRLSPTTAACRLTVFPSSRPVVIVAHRWCAIHSTATAQESWWETLSRLPADGHLQLLLLWPSCASAQSLSRPPHLISAVRVPRCSASTLPVLWRYPADTCHLLLRITSGRKLAKWHVKHYWDEAVCQLGANTLACIYKSFPVGYEMGAHIDWTLHCPLQRYTGYTVNAGTHQSLIS